MGKKDRRFVNVDERDIRVIKTEVVKPREFTPQPCQCSLCKAKRPQSQKEVNFTKVYKTRGNVHYCRCEFCGNTWAQYYGNRTSTMVQRYSDGTFSVVTSEYGIGSKPTGSN